MYNNGSSKENQMYLIQIWQTISKNFQYIKKPKIKRLKNIDLLSELTFNEELNVRKTNHAFRGNAMSYNAELVQKKDPIKQLEASKSSIKELFSDLLNETKGFNYQITIKVNLKNTSQKKLNLLQFIAIQEQKQ